MVLKKSECTFIYGVDESCEIPVQVSDRDASTLEGNFDALNIFPQCGNGLSIMELSKSD
jgi:hypothetical protein